MRRAIWLAMALAIPACNGGSTQPGGSRIQVTSGAGQTGRADSTLPLALTVYLSGTRKKSGRGILFAPQSDTTLVHRPLAAGNCTVLVERLDGQGGLRCSAVDSTNGSGQAFIVMTLGPTPGPGHLVVTLLQPLEVDTVTFTITP
jgi:hypothetical protein